MKVNGLLFFMLSVACFSLSAQQYSDKHFDPCRMKVGQNWMPNSDFWSSQKEKIRRLIVADDSFSGGRAMEAVFPALNERQAFHCRLDPAPPEAAGLEFELQLRSGTAPAYVELTQKNSAGGENLFRFSLPDLPVIAYRDKLARALFLDENKRHGHSSGMTKDIMKHVASKLSDPLYIFRSIANKEALVAVYPILEKQGNPVMLSLITNKSAGQNIEVNLISSMYGKRYSALQKWTENGLLLYRNDLEKSKAALSVRLQLPSDVTASIHNILVKSRICQQNEKRIE